MSNEEMKYNSGDFRSQYCTRLLNEADIVVTNPPFSLFREFFAWLMKADKKFIIVGNQNAITYKEVFPYIRGNKVWMGTGYSYSSLAGYFDSSYEDHAVTGEHKEGQIRVSGVCWFTNVDHQRRHEPLILVEKYSPDKYPKYDNYDAIEVNKTKNIPEDYLGVMGVPITFLHKYCFEQFDIVALRRNPDGTVEPWTVEREREFNDSILSSLDCRSDEERRRKAQWEDYLRSNPNTKEKPVDVFYPDKKNEKGFDRCYLNGKRMYDRVFIHRKVVN